MHCPEIYDLLSVIFVKVVVHPKGCYLELGNTKDNILKEKWRGSNKCTSFQLGKNVLSVCMYISSFFYLSVDPTPKCFSPDVTYEIITFLVLSACHTCYENDTSNATYKFQIN